MASYVTGAFSLQTYSTALLLWLSESPTLVCGFRNFLFIAATVMPIYLLTTLLNPRPIYAHLAVLSILAGVHLDFDSTYPQFVWPDMFSNGHIGTAYALLTVYLLVSGRRRLGFLALGLLPCIHAGQTPPVLVLGALMLLDAVRRRRKEELSQGLFFLAAGFAGCAIFRLAQHPFIIPPPVVDTGHAAVAILKTYLAGHDLHRSLPIGNCHLGLVMLLFGLASVLWIRRASGMKPGPWGWLFVYTGIIAGIVWTTAAIHITIGDNCPPILLQWMPYRLLNHVPLLLVAVLCALLGSPQTGQDRVHLWGGILLAGAVAYCMAIPYAGGLLPESLMKRYLVPNAGLLFALFGAAMGLLLFSSADTHGAKASRALAMAAMLVFLAQFHRFGAACYAAGVIAGAAPAILLKPIPLTKAQAAAKLLRVASIALMFASMALMLRGEHACRRNLPVSRFCQHVATYLAERHEPHALLLGEPFQLFLQASTGHAVMTDMALPTWIPYMPALAPAVEKMYRELFGIHFAKPYSETLSDNWRETWSGRTRLQWQALAAEYHFDYVAAPPRLALQLPTAFQEGDATLYAVPQSSGPEKAGSPFSPSALESHE